LNQTGPKIKKWELKIINHIILNNTIVTRVILWCLFK
jgi:hypothetical protein